MEEKGFTVAHAEKPATTWQRIWEILISYIDKTLEHADVGIVKEELLEMCTPEELKDLGIWTWLGFDDDEE